MANREEIVVLVTCIGCGEFVIPERRGREFCDSCRDMDRILKRERTERKRKNIIRGTMSRSERDRMMSRKARDWYKNKVTGWLPYHFGEEKFEVLG